jgi:hypothetical protein
MGWRKSVGVWRIRIPANKVLEGHCGSWPFLIAATEAPQQVSQLFVLATGFKLWGAKKLDEGAANHLVPEKTICL